MCRNGTHKISEYEESNCIPLFVLSVSYYLQKEVAKHMRKSFVAKHLIILLLAIPVNGISTRINSQP